MVSRLFRKEEVVRPARVLLFRGLRGLTGLLRVQNVFQMRGIQLR